MHGYTLLAHEAMAQMGGQRPTHVFVQAGVGGFAAATASYFASAFGSGRLALVVVESDRADCVLASLRAGSRTAVGGTHDTKMVGIACGEVSEIAWAILRHLTDHSVSIDDELARQTIRLAAQLEADVEIGETGVAGLAAICGICADAELRAKLSIDDDSVLLAFITEGITDEVSYQQFVRASRPS